MLTGTFKNKGARSKGTSSGADPCIEIDNTNSSNGSGGSAADNHLNQGNFTTQTNTIGGSMGGFGLYITGGGGGGGSRGTVICGELIMGNYIYSLNKNQNTKTQAKETINDDPCPEGEILLPVNKTPYKVINNLTNPCAKSIFTDLETEMLKKDLLKKIMYPTQNISLNFTESILKLFNDSSILNYSITNGYLKNSNGSTNGASTTISDSYIKNATQLSIARTIIHEMVHAYLNVKYNNPMSFDNGLDFKLKMETFAKDNGIKDINTNKFHHKFMGQYVDAIAISLVSWDEKYGTGGIKTKDLSGNDILDWEYYRSMAFGGLFQIDTDGNIVTETDSFKSLVPDTYKRKEIAKNLSNEQKGYKNAKGTKCN